MKTAQQEPTFQTVWVALQETGLIIKENSRETAEIRRMQKESAQETKELKRSIKETRRC